jgi:hypothetical protein
LYTIEIAVTKSRRHMYRVTNKHAWGLSVHNLRTGAQVASHRYPTTYQIAADHAALWVGGKHIRLYKDILNQPEILPFLCTEAVFETSFRVGDTIMCVFPEMRIDGWHVMTSVHTSRDTTPLYRITGTSRCRHTRKCMSAVHKSHTYVIPCHNLPVEQSRESRDVCTIVSLAPDHVCVGGGRLCSQTIATGDGCLYGINDHGRQITMFDPRDRADVSVLYADAQREYGLMKPRDVENGVLFMQYTECATELLELFDHRSCALIGTDIFVDYDDYLFCSRRAHTRN